ncbi:MAG: tryptophan synthase subunit alpha [Phycisphaerales bacterium]|nr:tryptophan synthase subunit alpha [Phycisphaerales bacterium]MCI0631883.1 tryptophan synthase subunit alpha [Phycisphaerales bacterium]MCI0676739.1 tryptophan synthase subunit alpha [Phycisphaerales bacterium]
MPFVCAGFPTAETTEQAIPALADAGAPIIEIGIPFSDPIADGPVIADAMHKALKSGITPARVFQIVKSVRRRTQAGLVAMVSDSIITRMGPERFISEAASAGFDGLIVPDIDLNAAAPLSGLARLHHLSFTLLIAPTTAPHRIGQIAGLCTGFIYLLARVGITGESDRLDIQDLKQRIDTIRRQTKLPIAVGFGVSRPQQAAQVATVADGVIVGSALVRRMGESPDPVRTAVDFVAQLSQKMDSAIAPA